MLSEFRTFSSLGGRPHTHFDFDQDTRYLDTQSLSGLAADKTINFVCDDEKAMLRYPTLEVGPTWLWRGDVSAKIIFLALKTFSNLGLASVVVHYCGHFRTLKELVEEHMGSHLLLMKLLTKHGTAMTCLTARCV